METPLTTTAAAEMEMIMAGADAEAASVEASAVTTIVDAVARGTMDAVITPPTAGEPAAQTTMDATQGQSSVLNQGLSKDPLCLARTQAADVRNHRTTVATVKE